VARALAAGDHAGAAGIEDADHDVGAGVLQARLQIVEADAGVAEAESAVLGVAREIQDQRRVLPLLAGDGGAGLQVEEGALEIVGAAVDEQERVVARDGAVAGEDVMDAAGVLAGVEKRAGVAAAGVVADDEGEAAVTGAARWRGPESAGHQRGRQEDERATSHGFLNNQVNCFTAPRPSTGRAATRSRLPSAWAWAARAARVTSSTARGRSERSRKTRSFPWPVNSRLSGK
jgi:hypothetical protein